MEGRRARPDSCGAGALSEVMTSARRVLGTVRWYVRGVTGADRYDRYVEHLRRTHPDAEIPSVKQFWRDTYAELDANPSTRCC